MRVINEVICIVKGMLIVKVSCVKHMLSCLLPHAQVMKEMRKDGIDSVASALTYSCKLVLLVLHRNSLLQMIRCLAHDSRVWQALPQSGEAGWGRKSWDSRSM